MTKRTIDDIDGDPIEIEIEDAPPAHDCIMEAIDALLLARYIRDGKPAQLLFPTNWKSVKWVKKSEA